MNDMNNHGTSGHICADIVPDIEAVRTELKAFAAKRPEAAPWCSRIRDNLRRLADDPDHGPHELRVQTMRNAASLRASLSSRK